MPDINFPDTVQISFNSKFTIYEHTAICTLDKGEFNFTTNQTMNEELFDNLTEGNLTPYITTIGLYNSNGDLIAIGKLPRPLKRAPEVDQTFIIKFDV